MHLQQYDENHCVYLARIGRHGAKKMAKNVTDHACAA